MMLLKKVMLSLLVTISTSCSDFKFKTIFTYSHSENPDACYWLNSKTGERIPCVDERLKKYMCIPIQDYIDFRQDYQCALKKDVEKAVLEGNFRE
jgi:predicted ATPase with chaperone activity